MKKSIPPNRCEATTYHGGQALAAYATESLPDVFKHTTYLFVIQTGTATSTSTSFGGMKPNRLYALGQALVAAEGTEQHRCIGPIVVG